ncbi:MAG: metal ABC transporter permease [Phycisphaerae bacterium]
MQFFNDMSQNQFLLTGMLAGLLASLACGIMGPFVIAKRIVFLSGAIAHMSVGGIGAAIFLAVWFPDSLGWLHPLHGAVTTALLAAVLIGLIQGRVAERMDTLIGALWAVGMAAGILLIKFTPNYQATLMDYLFGSLAFVSWSEIRLMIYLNALIIFTMLLCYKRMLAICLDEQQAELQGVNIVMSNILLLALVALTVICLIQVVGSILVIALLTLPAATMSHHVNRMSIIIVGSGFLAMFLTTVPRIAVYGTRVSPESAIVLAAALLYLVSTLLRLGGRSLARRRFVRLSER